MKTIPSNSIYLFLFSYEKISRVQANTNQQKQK